MKRSIRNVSALPVKQMFSNSLFFRESTSMPVRTSMIVAGVFLGLVSLILVFFAIESF
jgi:hypothetical protein